MISGDELAVSDVTNNQYRDVPQSEIGGRVYRTRQGVGLAIGKPMARYVLVGIVLAVGALLAK